MQKIERFNSINYINEYQRTPLHPVLRIHMGTITIKFDQTILEMEIFQHILSPSSFSYSLFSSRLKWYLLFNYHQLIVNWKWLLWWFEQIPKYERRFIDGNYLILFNLLSFIQSFTLYLVYILFLFSYNIYSIYYILFNICIVILFIVKLIRKTIMVRLLKLYLKVIKLL